MEKLCRFRLEIWRVIFTPHSLAECLREKGDLESARQLILHNLRFVVKVARGYNGYGLPLSDLVQEGNVGLMKAVKRFDPGMNVRLISFAVHWIRAEIHEYIQSGDNQSAA